MQAAFAYVNDQLGGIGGHPIKLVPCAAANTDEDVQKCAQQMLNDSSVSVVVEGGLNFGTQVIHSILGSTKPIIEAESNPGPDTSATNSFSTNAGAVALVNGFGAYAKQQNIRTVAMISGDATADAAIAGAVKGSLGAGGATVKYVTFPETGTDLLTPLTAAGATSADAVVPLVVNPPQCAAAAKALDQLGVQPKKVLAVGLCASSAVKSQLGTYPKWTYVSSTLSLDAPDSTGQVALYKAIMAKYAPPNAELSIDAPFSFGAAFAAVKVLNAVGPNDVTPQAVSDALRAFAGPVILGPPTLKFGAIPTMPALGSVASRVYEFDGQWSSVSDWIS
jgi:branched-chain amino acid transport system substrate-binding protein